eukprot:gb/GFBE01053236.1/.p1 GENE.gb/GFBE01053236.1/~~gb/GFBE01053236.1/.p1  ORF type:complete len:202 (+),score=55.66 gb/GFBE01053236.1/:1-606(+)
MPVICIGPVCIPWTCIPAIIFFLWKFAKPLLPEAWALAIEKYASKLSDFLAPYLEKVPGFKKKKKTAAAESGGNGVSCDFKGGEVVELASEEQFSALLTRSKQEGFALVLDFTATWCKPCQAIKPRFKAMAAEHPNHCFAMVDADDLDDVLGKCGVMGLPTFQVYNEGEQVGSVTGGEEDKLVKLIGDHLGTPAAADKKER